MTFLDAQEQRILLPFFSVMAFIFGACCGSFFNVCVYRIPAKKSLLWPPSHCYSCGVHLKWYDNIPILGWPLLRGKCRYCGTPYSARYCLIELLTAVLYLLAFWVYGPTSLLFFIWIFLGLLIIGTFTDIDHFIIPNRVNYGGLAIGLLGGVIIGSDWPAAIALRSLIKEMHFILYGDDTFVWWNIPSGIEGFTGAVCGAVAGWIALWTVSFLGKLLFRKEAMGFGDVKLMGFLGAFVGIQGCFMVIGLASLLGALVSVCIIIWHHCFKKDEFEEFVLDKRKLLITDMSSMESVLNESRVKIPLRTTGQLHYLPFGPYLAVAAVILILGHEQISKLVIWWVGLE